MMDTALLFFNIVNTYVIFDFMRSVYGFKYNKAINTAAILAFYGLHTYVNMQHNAVNNFIIEAIMIQITSFALFKKRKGKYCFNGMFQVYLIAVDVTVSAGYALLKKMNMEQIQNEQLGLTFCGIFIFIVVLTTYRKMIKLFDIQFDNQDHKALIGIVTIQYIIFFTVMRLYEHIVTSIFILFIIIIVFVFKICGFYYLLYKQKHRDAQREIEKHRHQGEILYKAMEIEQRKNAALRKVRHDIQSHIDTAETLGGVAKIEYLKAIKTNIDQEIGQFITGSDVLDAIVNSAYIKAKAKQITLQMDIERANWNFIHPFDMTTIFSNILNNAVEYTESGQTIHLSVKNKEGFIAIILENPCNLAKIKRNGEAFETTGQGDHQGIGLENIKRTAEKQNGFTLFEIKDDKFIAKILLPATK